VVHDLDGKQTQCFDVKIGPDFIGGLLKDGCQVGIRTDSKSLMQIISEEEKSYNDDAYKLAV
jgi:hypothetical protein